MSIKKVVFGAVAAGLAVLLCACAVKLDVPKEYSSADEAAIMGFGVADEYVNTVAVGQFINLTVKIKTDYDDNVTWRSSDSSIATVDSNGRVDGVKKGEVTITASARKAEVSYAIKVTGAVKPKLTYSTAITGNASRLKQVLSNDAPGLPYAVLINRKSNCVTVYTYNDYGIYNVPVRSMVCSTGKDASTPDEKYQVLSKDRWEKLDDGNFSQYAVLISEDLMILSTPYSAEDESKLITDSYNSLGTDSTDGNVWLSASDAKWIYDNCPDGTLVKVTGTAANPLGVPVPLKLGDKSVSKTWDPTSNNPDNPFNSAFPVISGTDEITVKAESVIDLYSGITAVDSCGNDITPQVKTFGYINRDKEGTYIISYSVTDSLGRSSRADRAVNVVFE